jgi:hypothetical protein
MAQRARWYQESLHDEEIVNDLYSDNLSDTPDDIFSESDIASGSDKEGVNVLSECESGSEGSDSDDTTRVKVVKVDKTHTLGQFTGNPGVKQVLLHPTQVSETGTAFVWPRPSTPTPRMSCVDPMGDFRVICRNMSSQKL